MIIFLFKGIRLFHHYAIFFISTIFCKIKLWLNGAKFKSIKSFGVPFIHVSSKGQLVIGNNLTLNNGIRSCESGNNGRCRFKVENGAMLTIGDNVGMSAVTISCQENIIIKDNVTLGVGVHIYDTDFHSLNPKHRSNFISDTNNKKTKQVIIQNNVFVGAHCVILKGVNIGENSVIGAGSIVSKSIPANVIAAGNPCKIVKELFF